MSVVRVVRISGTAPSDAAWTVHLEADLHVSGDRGLPWPPPADYAGELLASVAPVDRLVFTDAAVFARAIRGWGGGWANLDSSVVAEVEVEGERFVLAAAFDRELWRLTVAAAAGSAPGLHVVESHTRRIDTEASGTDPDTA